MDDDDRDLFDSLSGPLGDVIAQVGVNLAEAQRALDGQAIDNFRALYGETGEHFAALRQIGYRPTFYHIPECAVEMQIALTLNGQRRQTGRPGGLRMYAAPVDASYANTFEFGLQASSKLSFKIVPVPPPGDFDRFVGVPALSGLTLAEARAEVAAVGLTLESDPADADGSAVVGGQDPEPGEVVPEGAIVAVAVDV